MAYRDPAVGRATDRERFRKRTAARRTAGLCPRCGEVPPEPDRSLCAGCADRRNKASRARDARLRVAGNPRRDPVRARDYERERSRKERAAHHPEGVCTRCGKLQAATGRSSCEPCLDKRRASDRTRYQAGKAAGLKYGGADIEVKRRSGRAKSKRRLKERSEAGLCIRCGKLPPVPAAAASLHAGNGRTPARCAVALSPHSDHACGAADIVSVPFLHRACQLSSHLIERCELSKSSIHPSPQARSGASLSRSAPPLGVVQWTPPNSIAVAIAPFSRISHTDYTSPQCTDSENAPYGTPNEPDQPATGPASPGGGGESAQPLPLARLVGRDRA